MIKLLELVRLSHETGFKGFTGKVTIQCSWKKLGSDIYKMGSIRISVEGINVYLQFSAGRSDIYVGSRKINGELEKAKQHGNKVVTLFKDKSVYLILMTSEETARKLLVQIQYLKSEEFQRCLEGQVTDLKQAYRDGILIKAQVNEAESTLFQSPKASRPSVPVLQKGFLSPKLVQVRQELPMAKSCHGSPVPKIPYGQSVPVVYKGLLSPKLVRVRQELPMVKSCPGSPVSLPKIPYGFPNLGNTCYMNAVLHCLFSLAPLVETFKALGGEDARVMRTLINLMDGRYTCPARHLATQGRLRAIREVIEKKWSNTEQQDAHEFLGLLLDHLREEFQFVHATSSGQKIRPLLELRSNSDRVNNFAVHGHFEMLVQQTVKCMGCGAKSIKEIPQNEVTLCISESPQSLQCHLSSYFRGEIISFKCSSCPCHQGKMSLRVTRLPRILIILLKRSLPKAKSSAEVVLSKSISLMSPTTGLDRSEAGKMLAINFTTPRKRICLQQSQSCPKKRRLETTEGMIGSGSISAKKGLHSMVSGRVRDVLKNASSPRPRPLVQKKISFAFETQPACLVSTIDDDSVTESKENEGPEEYAQIEVEPGTTNDNLPVEYQLTSIVSHIGTCSSQGHYISDSLDLDSNRWHTFNDEVVKETTASDVIRSRSKSAYMLFFVSK